MTLRQRYLRRNRRVGNDPLLLYLVVVGVGHVQPPTSRIPGDAQRVLELDVARLAVDVTEGEQVLGESASFEIAAALGSTQAREPGRFLFAAREFRWKTWSGVVRD